MPTLFEFVKTQLQDIGERGESPATLYRQAKGAGAVTRRATYPSFMRMFHYLVGLGWVEFTGRTEPSYQKGVQTSGVLSDRRAYRITGAGNEGDWRNPQSSLYPQFGPAYWQEYRRRRFIPSTRPRGRPRRERARRVPAAVLELAPEMEFREPARLIRFPASTRVRVRLEGLRPLVESLRDSFDVEVLNKVGTEFLSINDSIEDALDNARGEQRRELQELQRTLSRASEGVEMVERGGRTRSRVVYLEGWERLKQCCGEK